MQFILFIMDATQVKHVCQSAYFQLHGVSNICQQLDATTKKKLVHAVVFSHLDFCNSALIGAPSSLITRLQRDELCEEL